MDTAIWVAVIGGLFSLMVVIAKKIFETRSVNIAVLSEVQRLLAVIEEHKTWWDQCASSGNTNFPLIPFSTPIFDVQKKNIGQLGTTVVARIAKFYGYLEFINSLQAQRPIYISAGQSKNFDAQYSKVLDRVLRDYKGSFHSAFEKYRLL